MLINNGQLLQISQISDLPDTRKSPDIRLIPKKAGYSAGPISGLTLILYTLGHESMLYRVPG